MKPPPRGRALTALAVLTALQAHGCKPSASSEATHLRTQAAAGRSGDNVSATPTPPRVGAELTHAASVRRLQPLRDVEIRSLDPADLARRALELSLQQTTAESREAELAFGQALGLLPAGFDASAALVELATSSLLGLYDPRQQVILLRHPPAEDQARHQLHECVHALQDQHFGIGKQLSSAPGRGDAIAALLSLAEGDATLAERVAQLGPSLESLDHPFPDLPRVIIDASTATYVDGLRFATSMYERGGFRAIDEVWRDPPKSTEQLLHPEKYASREKWRTFDAPRLAGCTSYYWDVVGEQGLGVVLREWVDEPTSKVAAAGWDGDRADILMCGEAFVVTWRIGFDSEADAKQAHHVVDRAAPACSEPGAHWLATLDETQVSVVASTQWSCGALRDALAALL